MNIHELKQIKKLQLERMSFLIEIDAPSAIVLQDVLLLGARLSGSECKFIKLALRSWWATSRANPMHYYRAWKMSKEMSKEESKLDENS